MITLLYLKLSIQCQSLLESDPERTPGNKGFNFFFNFW